MNHRHLYLLAVLCGLLAATSASAAARWTQAESMATARRLHTMTPLPNGKLLVAGGFAADGTPLASAELFDPATGLWTPANAMSVPRAQHTATLIPDGRVLVVAGRSSGTDQIGFNTAELYDPVSGNWTSVTQAMPAGKFWHSSVLLRNGKVLSCGGNVTAACYLFTPKTGGWTSTGSMLHDRIGFALNVLQDGRVVATGGRGYSGFWMTQAEIYDPAAGIWQALPDMQTPRYRHTGTVLPDGRLLVTGGETAANSVGTASAETLDPTTLTWSSAGALTSTRMNHSASLLPDGRVYFVGGQNGNQLTDIFDPATNQWSTGPSVVTPVRWQQPAVVLPGGRIFMAGGIAESGTVGSTELFDPADWRWGSSGNLGTAREEPAVSVLPDGDVLAVGGNGAGGTYLASAERYDTATGTWSAAGSMAQARAEGRATLLPDGRVLVSGGYYVINSISYSVGPAELYDPATGTWSITGSLVQGRSGHTATLLKDGRVLVTGGNLWGPDAEIYDPAAGTWTVTGAMSTTSRHRHSATLLADGRVLVAGGYQFNYPNYTYLALAELYDPVSNTWTPVEGMPGPRAFHSATLLPDGTVLVAGGEYEHGSPRRSLSTTVTFDPATGTWRSEGSLTWDRLSHHAALLPSGRVVVVGGASYGGGTPTAEIYDPVTHLWTEAGALSEAKFGLAFAPLPDGKLLLAGGRYNGDPKIITETFEESGSLVPARRPVIAPTSASLYPGMLLGFTGSGLTGDSNASFGTANESPGNFPLLQLRRLEGGVQQWLQPDLPWNAGYFGGLSASTLPVGHYFATAFVNGVPSLSRIVAVKSRPTQLFADVPGSHWAGAYIDALFTHGITTGCGTPGNYCPSQYVTREQMAAFIIRAVEGEPAACAAPPFPDVPTSNAFCKYIKRMLDLSITTGCGGGNYCPSQNVTRDQMAAFIIRAVEGNPLAGYCGSTSPFADVPTSSGFCGHIKRMLELNITIGCGGGNYCPTQAVTREQMAAFLGRAFLGM